MRIDKHTRIASYLDELRASYWFIPTVMSFAAILLSFVTTSIDARVGTSWLEDINWLYANKPAGARTVLSTIAGSMITVAGVVFSITIAAVSYASSQYGPRLLSNFMRNRGNQFTLGTFIATFIYCLLVIRTVRSREELPPGVDSATDLVGAFVPNIAILTGIALALCSIAVLIFFVHHVPRSIHISYVIADIGRELRSKIDVRFPILIGEELPGVDQGPKPEPELPPYFRSRLLGTPTAEGSDEITEILAKDDGFVQAIDENKLLETATEFDLILRLQYRPGDFIQHDGVVIQAWPSDRVTDDVADTLRNCYIWGATRTSVQDVMFLVDELVEIAARAISPGINDPFTAKNCLNWLGVALSDLSGRELPDPMRYDDDNQLRVIAYPTTFADFVETALGQMRQYVSRDVVVTLYMLRTIGEVAVGLRSEVERQAMRDELSQLLDACEYNLEGNALTTVNERAAMVRNVIDSPERAGSLLDQQGFLGGRG